MEQKPCPVSFWNPFLDRSQSLLVVGLPDSQSDSYSLSCFDILKMLVCDYWKRLFSSPMRKQIIFEKLTKYKTAFGALCSTTFKYT
jgi:hypothetical protein